MKQIAFGVPTHNKLQLKAGCYISDDTMKTVKASQNLHTLTLYDTDSVAHVVVMGVVLLTQTVSNLAISALREHFVTPNGLLIPFVGIDHHKGNASIGRKFYSPQHLLNLLIFAFAGDNERISFGDVNFTLNEVRQSANIIFANNASKLAQFDRICDELTRSGTCNGKRGFL